MGRISFKDNGEEHNFWQNYTDLMSGFLIVFIIASLSAYGSYKEYFDLYHEKGITEKNIDTIMVNAELYKKIRDFQEAQKSLNSKYFVYKKEYQRFECKVDVEFTSESSTIPEGKKRDLINAGKELKKIIDDFKGSENISFKVVIEGRAAKKHDNPYPTQRNKDYAAKLSYERARNLYLLWKGNRLLTSIEDGNGEVFVCGSGFEGKGRYSGYGTNGEDRNKTFIIQIIPYINSK